MMKYLTTFIDGYTLEVDHYFLNVSDAEAAEKYVRKQLGDEANITYHDNGDIISWIPCDEHHMLKDTELWLQLIENVKEVTV